MNMNGLVQTFRNIVENFNILEGQNRGLKLDFHIFSSATDTHLLQLRNYNISNSGESITSMLYFARGRSKISNLENSSIVRYICSIDH